MAVTTIKVPVELRDRIISDAHARGLTIARFLADLLDDRARQQRMAALGRSIQDNPPDEDYWRDLGAPAVQA